MAYLITHVMPWLLVVMAFAALSGWALFAMRADMRDQPLEKERARLMNELAGVAPSESALGALQFERGADQLRLRADMDSARIAELESQLRAARQRMEAADARIAELQSGSVIALKDPDVEAERDQLRARVKDIETERDGLTARLAGMQADASRAAEAEAQRLQSAAKAAETDAEDAAVKAWRLRYFERRVTYLESQASTEPSFALPPAPPPESPPAPPPAPQPVLVETRPDLASQWRARYFASRTKYLEDELRAQVSAPAPEPIAAIDEEAERAKAWRMRYLEKRVQYLQDAAQQPAPAEPVVAPEEPPRDEAEAERLKWRVRFLEARVRHFERPPPKAAAEPVAAPIVQAAPEPVEEPPPQPVMEVAPARAPVPQGPTERPASLPAARGGAPDDFTLIEGVRPLQQKTLNSLGIYHFDQIAAWSDANVAWVDQYLRLRGRIAEEEWVAQADELARGVGVARAERVLEDEAV